MVTAQQGKKVDFMGFLNHQFLRERSHGISRVLILRRFFYKNFFQKPVDKDKKGGYNGIRLARLGAGEKWDRQQTSSGCPLKTE